MKRFMVLVFDGDNVSGRCFDSAAEADSYRMDASCSMGLCAQVFESAPIDPDDPEAGSCYEFSYE